MSSRSHNAPSVPSIPHTNATPSVPNVPTASVSLMSPMPLSVPDVPSAPNISNVSDVPNVPNIPNVPVSLTPAPSLCCAVAVGVSAVSSGVPLSSSSLSLCPPLCHTMASCCCCRRYRLERSDRLALRTTFLGIPGISGIPGAGPVSPRSPHCHQGPPVVPCPSHQWHP